MCFSELLPGFEFVSFTDMKVPLGCAEYVG